MRTIFTALVALLLPALAAGDSGINTRVFPQAILRGNSVFITCRVTPNEANRKLIYGVRGSDLDGIDGGSQRDLLGPPKPDGTLDWTRVPITWGPVEAKHVQCDGGPAYCVVVRADGSTIKDVRPINVGGCEP